jgi:uncharacterized protein (DUF433 family)
VENREEKYLARVNRNHSPKIRQSLRDIHHRNQNAVGFYLTAIVAKSYEVGGKQAAKVAESKDFNNVVMKITRKLCEEHPNITIDSEMLGGVPHIKGFRLSVGNVLGKLYTYGSIEKVREIYSDISEAQIKEAIAFAQDFLENACASSESY